MEHFYCILFQILYPPEYLVQNAQMPKDSVVAPQIGMNKTQTYLLHVVSVLLRKNPL